MDWGYNTASMKYTASLPASSLESRQQRTDKQATKQPTGARTLKARLLRKLSNIRVRKQSKARLRQPAHNNKGPTEIYIHTGETKKGLTEIVYTTKSIIEPH